MNLKEAVAQIADKYHNQIVGQKRKYTGEKYTVHTNAVADMYASFFPDDIVGQAAGEGHDLFEDTPLTPDLLKEELSKLGFDPASVEVADLISLIVELTDVYTREKFPQKNRKERKALEAARLETISTRAKGLKICDLINNSDSIVAHDPGFARTYLPEKLHAVGSLAGQVPQVLLNRAMNQVLDGFAKLGMTIPMFSAPTNA